MIHVHYTLILMFKITKLTKSQVQDARFSNKKCKEELILVTITMILMFPTLHTDEQLVVINILIKLFINSII
jgi:hypothetical protein